VDHKVEGLYVEQTHLNIDDGTNDLGDLTRTVGSGSSTEGAASACYW
jgi:hypothetical protein